MNRGVSILVEGSRGTTGSSIRRMSLTELECPNDLATERDGHDETTYIRKYLLGFSPRFRGGAPGRSKPRLFIGCGVA